MERIGIRELRNNASRVVRRAQAGHRIVITVDGVPAARIGPLDDGHPDRTLDDLIAAGLVIPPRTTVPPARPHPVPAPSGESSIEVLRRDRDR
ncbi:MAG: type II toxin-antitoxin system prevent-host-death family antitoxin [Chloroflexi bacterium]|nr:type II toxin-antitoxin system prevent-host-death family antitoxin [Chloroflexota bacterium]